MPPESAGAPGACEQQRRQFGREARKLLDGCSARSQLQLAYMFRPSHWVHRRYGVVGLVNYAAVTSFLASFVFVRLVRHGNLFDPMPTWSDLGFTLVGVMLFWADLIIEALFRAGRFRRKRSSDDPGE